MKRFSFALVLLALTALMNGCDDLKVTTDYDKKADFTKYKTYAIDTFRQSQSISQLNQRRILDAVKAAMASKGFKESSNPDLLVHISAILKDQASVSSNTDLYGYGGLYRPYAWGGGMVSGYTTYDVHHYKNGSLIINIADAASKNLVWEGIGNKEIDGPIKDIDNAVPYAVNKIMEGFPPGRPVTAK